MKIGLLTTIKTNVGDDLIRLGIKRMLQQAFKGPIEWVEVNKHTAWTAFKNPIVRETVKRLQNPSFVARYPLLKKYEASVCRRVSSCFDDCDMVIQCGAPVFWSYCHLAEWAGPLWYGALMRLSRRMPVYNLAAGSCYPWTDRDHVNIPEQDAAYIRHIHSVCATTTVRDKLAGQICEQLGLETRVLPCTALLSADDIATASAQVKGTKRILVNYMPGAGHYAFDQPIDAADWEATLVEVLKRFQGEYGIAFVCHNQAEAEASRKLGIDGEIVVAHSAESYHQTAGAATVAICNRIHASVALASAGIPSVTVGTDTRLLMSEEAGIRSEFVSDMTADRLAEAVQSLIQSRDQESEKLLALKAETKAKYTDIFA